MDDLRDAVSFHQMLLSANGASPATLTLYRIYELAFLEFLESRRVKPLISELNPRRVTECLVWYRNQARGIRTRNGEVAVKTLATVLKRLGTVLEENEYVEDNPLRKLPRPRITYYSRVPFTQVEVNALWSACFRTQNPARDEALFLLLIDTGMRIGEAVTLTLDRLNLDHGQVTVMGKGRRERVVPIGQRVARAIKRYLLLREQGRNRSSGKPTVRPDGEPYVFLTYDGHPLQPDGGHEVIKHLGDLAGVADAYPHRCRHTFCTFYLTVHPGDELGLRRIVGHLSKEVLANYVHLADTTISQRQQRSSLAETWLSGARPMAQIVSGRERSPLQESAAPHPIARPANTNRHAQQ